MNEALLDEIVDATLYEGYILYPYRATSKKNRRERFTFGRVYPESYSLAQDGAEPCLMRTECLVRLLDPAAKLDVSVRFLQPLAREIGQLIKPIAEWDGNERNFHIVPELRVGGELFQTWLEAMERDVHVETLGFGKGNTQQTRFHFDAWQELKPIREAGSIAAVEIRRLEALDGTITLEARPITEALYKISVQVMNSSALSPGESALESSVLLRLFASTHTILRVRGGEFISQMDPPPELKSEVAACKNIGTWPVLVGEEAKGERDTMLSAPIILYDYPKIAPESAGSLYDGTEIDEILTLRILTMTDDEKNEMRLVDERARRLLERTEALPENALLQMHGTLREKQDAAAVEFDDFFGANTSLQGVSISGVYVKPGDRVRIRPKVRADIIDVALSGKVGIVEAVEEDMEKRVHLAVVMENDPGKDLGMMRQPGHRFFYGAEEIEPLVEGAG